MCCTWSLNHVRLFVTPWTVACQDPLSMGILRARILEWVAMSSSRGSSHPRDQTQASHIADGFFTIWATREATSTLIKVTYDAPLSSLSREDTAGRHHLCTRKGALTRDWILWHFDLRLPRLQNHRKERLSFINHLTYGIFSQVWTD